MAHWYLLNKTKIYGPLSANEILGQNLFHSQQVLLWCKGKPRWLELSAVESELREEVESATFDATIPRLEIFWYIKDHESEIGPLLLGQLIVLLVARSSLEGVQVCNETDRRWQEVYQWNEVVQLLGVAQRVDTRVPLIGSISVINGKNEGHEGVTTTISQGGFGVNGANRLTKGERFNGRLCSPQFNTPLEFQAEVLFSNPERFYSAKFIQIDGTSRQQIIDYISLFSSDKNDKNENHSFNKTA